MIDPRIFVPLEEVLADHPFPGSPHISNIIGPPLTPQIVEGAERTLAIKLPIAYIELLRISNGGYLRYRYLPTSQPNSWADGFVEISEIMGLGYERGLDGDFFADETHAEWGYPPETFYFSGDGHTGFLLDYRECGPTGEPSVAWIDVEEEPPLDIKLANSFEEFLGSLREEEPAVTEGK
jgi:hypothetical protein